LASAIGRLRLEWDVATTQLKLYQVLGRSEEVVTHEALIRNIVSRIVASLHEPALRAGLPDT
jgi:hypothetical protein